MKLTERDEISSSVIHEGCVFPSVWKFKEEVIIVPTCPGTLSGIKYVKRNLQTVI